MGKLINIDEWTKVNGSIVFNDKLKDVYAGYRWMSKLERLENNVNERIMMKIFGEDEGARLWRCFVQEANRNIFKFIRRWLTVIQFNELSLCLEFKEEEIYV